MKVARKIWAAVTHSEADPAWVAGLIVAAWVFGLPIIMLALAL